jgi:hypothetical protein
MTTDKPTISNADFQLGRVLVPLSVLAGFEKTMR